MKSKGYTRAAEAAGVVKQMAGILAGGPWAVRALALALAFEEAADLAWEEARAGRRSSARGAYTQAVAA